MDDATPASPKKVDVDGASLSVEVSGSGSPAIVFLNSSGGEGDEWDQVRAQLRSDTTVVTYGRPGLAGSDPLPGGETEREHGAGWAAQQLRGVLSGAGIEPPYLLVSSSLGAWILGMYAAEWSGELAGAIAVDPTMRKPWPEEIVRGPVIEDGDEGGIRFPLATCYVELAEPLPSPVPRCLVVSSSVGRWQRDPPENPWYEPLSLDEVDRLWQGYQRDWAQHLSATHVIANSAGHFVHEDAPELVVLVIHAVVDAARNKGAVQLSANGLEEAGGYVASTAS